MNIVSVDHSGETIDSSLLPDLSERFPDGAGQEALYAAHMEARQRAFQTIFGESNPPGMILIPSDPNLTINWPGGGVYVYPPGGDRTGWHYVTHGLAQPMGDDISAEPSPDDEEQISGWGIELVLSTPEKNSWAPDVLFNLTKYILFQTSSRVILPGDRIPCNGPLVLGTDTPLRHLIAVRSPEYASNVRLPAGYCWLVHLIGTTNDEIAYANQWGIGTGGTAILEAVFASMGVQCLTDPNRRSLTERAEFKTIWRATQERLESEWRANGWSGEGKS